MLILSRKSGQIITIGPVIDNTNPLLPTPYFTDGPIEILVTRVQGDEVRLGISAHCSLVIQRGEALPWENRQGDDGAPRPTTKLRDGREPGV
jgi:sRNA-binding carbon storage regulator CsrA